MSSKDLIEGAKIDGKAILASKEVELEENKPEAQNLITKLMFKNLSHWYLAEYILS